MPHAAIKQHNPSEDHATSVRPSGTEVLEETAESDARGQLLVVQNSTAGPYPATQPEIARRSAGLDLSGDGQTLVHRLVPHSPGHDRLMNARQVAEKLGVSERFIRDHTTRRTPRIPAVKLGKLIRYRLADVDAFMAELHTLPPSHRSRFGV
jgi:excisionase family DNA binding protein